MYFWGFIYVEISFFLPLILLHTPTISHLWHFPRWGPQQRSCSFWLTSHSRLTKSLLWRGLLCYNAQLYRVPDTAWCWHTSLFANATSSVHSTPLKRPWAWSSPAPRCPERRGAVGAPHEPPPQEQQSSDLAPCIRVGNKTKREAADKRAL